MPEIEVNTEAAQEHVGEIKHGIIFIKERCRGTWAIMPLKRLPKSFVIHLVYFCVMWINLLNEEAVIINTNRGRTFPGILLGPTGSIQGTHFFWYQNGRDQKM